MICASRKPVREKYFALPVGQIISTTSRVSRSIRGALRIVTNVGAGCDGRFRRN
jgi:hypothetical protein